MDIDDAALMYEGWVDEKIYEQETARRMTMIIADVTNKSFGGKGIMKKAKDIWPLPGDKKIIRADPSEMLKKFRDLDLQKGLKNGKR